ncbi:MAG TPA: hypothetical protein GYA07_13085 [Verrucomicrobia bacterium]|nr:hypothetical protein [Verrucomicrobiota bacterium]HPU57547.1 hypothetical protein [Verrucomicrobiota bacterium]
MKTKDLATMGSAALVTASLTAAALLIHPLHADNDTAAKEVAQPKLVANGIEFTLVPKDNRVPQAGDEPELVLTALNTGSTTAEASIEIIMTASSPASMLSRIPTRPEKLWQHPCSLTLKANETKTILLATGIRLPPDQIIQVTMQPAKPEALPGVTDAPGEVRNLVVFDPTAVVAQMWSTMARQQEGTLVTAR